MIHVFVLIRKLRDLYPSCRTTEALKIPEDRKSKVHDVFEQEIRGVANSAPPMLVYSDLPVISTWFVNRSKSSSDNLYIDHPTKHIYHSLSAIPNLQTP